MKNASLVCSVLAALASLPVAAQVSSSSPGSPQSSTPTVPSAASQTSAAPSTSQQAVPVQSTANAPEVENAQLRPVAGELQTKIDSKSAKPGETVVVKTTEKATTANGTVIPKGSKIIGHVTDVAAHDSSNPNGRVTLQFDQAQLKGGQQVPIKSVLQSVAPAAGEGAPSDAFSSSAPTAMPSGGGAAGSGAAPSSGSGSSSAMAAPRAEAPQASSAAPSAGTTAASGASASGAPPVGTVVAKNGNVAIRTTAVPGLLIAANANGQPFSNASGALLAARENVHLDNGTKIVLAVADIPANPSR